MTDPFVHPREPTADAATAAIAEEFGFFDDWMDRYGLVIDWGRSLPPFPPEWQDDAHKVEGCQSQVWLASELREGRLHLAAGSDAAIVAGLVAMLLRIYSGRTPEEVLATDAGAFLKDLDLIGNLSANRGNGIAAMIARIRGIATHAAATASR
ncbi:SufE family protein [Elioraea sp.]|uniref:SufE family protein n=1 Tax=Elioraea sp. TaxID=2185103 RepID=UPI0025C10089|nr:SufE family protein [Elioraea sp.]